MQTDLAVAADRAPARRRFRTRWIAMLLGLTLATVSTLAAIDVAAVDPTSGGYEPPYSGVVGDPIDWDATETTDAGMVQRGRVLDVHTDCTTGMIRVEVFGLVGFDHRHLSERAIVVHDPVTACEERGFAPSFGGS